MEQPDIEYITLYRECEYKFDPFKLKLTSDIDYWDKARIQTISEYPQHFSKVIIGPSTVFEHYDTDTFDNLKNRIINNTNTEMIYHIGCRGENGWMGYPNSFIVMTLDYYNQLHGIKYCVSDSQCGANEKCLCADGKEHPSWCPVTGRRCLNKGYFVHEAPIPVLPNDNVNVQCVAEKLNGDTQVTDDVIKQYEIQCAFEKRDSVMENDVTGKKDYMVPQLCNSPECMVNNGTIMTVNSERLPENSLVQTVNTDVPMGSTVTGVVNGNIINQISEGFGQSSNTNHMSIFWSITWIILLILLIAFVYVYF